MTSFESHQRRPLQFADLSQVIPDVERQRESHRTVGNWTLAQICKHLADGVNGAIDGFDLSRHRFKRRFFAKPMLLYTYRYGIPPNYLVDPALTPPASVKLADAIDELDRAIQRYQNHNGVLQAHPLFGKMPRPAWDRIQRIHCAHHLSFALPAISTYP